MELYTVTVYNRNLAKKKGITFLDITAKSGKPWLAPDWISLMRYKNGQLTEDEYTTLYYAKMRKSYKDNKRLWLDLLKTPKLAIGCYCKPHTYCHRKLLVDMLIKVGASVNITVTYCGELEP